MRFAAVFGFVVAITGGLAAAVGAHPTPSAYTTTSQALQNASSHKTVVSALGAATPIFRSVLSVSSDAGFEGADGNLTHETATDWNDFAPPNWVGVAPYQSATGANMGWTFYGRTDARGSLDGGNDTTYAGGVKQADECPAIVSTGSKASTSNKSDLARIYIAGKIVNGNVYLALAWVRVPQNTTSSDVHVAFEFNQSTTGCANGTDLVQRTNGDLLIVYNFQSGSASLAISSWGASGWSPETDLPADTATATVFPGPNTTSDALKPSGAPDPATNEFGEAIINLTKASIDFSGSGRTCQRFGRVFGESRSSGSSTQASMEDLVGPANVDLSNCVTPGITTTPNPTSGFPGATLNDTADLSGGNNPTGNVTFNLYGPSDQTCQGPAIYTETADLSGTHAATVNGPAQNASGTYHWTATYNGDGNNNTVTSPCADEAVTLAKNSPTIATVLSATTGAVGAAVHDSATLTGATTDASGTATYRVYTDITCSTLATVGTDIDAQPAAVTVAAHLVPNSPNVTFLRSGDFYWQVVYGGDTKNNGATSPCTANDNEHLAIAKNSPTIATVLSATTGAIGAAVHDSSTLTGATSGAGGTATYRVYTDITCSTLAAAGTDIDAQPAAVTVAAHLVPNSPDVTFLRAGNFYWQVVYGGDANNNAATSPCTANDNEHLAIAKNSPTIATVLSATTGAIGAAVHDSSTLTGATTAAGGTATYRVYTNITCTTLAAVGTDIDAQPAAVTVANHLVPNSPDVTFLRAGDFYWQVVYGGDANNNGATSPCTANDNEHLAIAKNSPTIATVLSATAGAVNDKVHDSSTLTGATSAASGTATYRVYTNVTCTTLAAVGTDIDAQPAAVTVANHLVPNSPDVTFLRAGDFYWQVVYGGDANNNAATSPCTANDNEHLSIGKNSPTIATVLSATTGAIGDAVHDSSTLTGATSAAGGTATYRVYTNVTCTTLAAAGTDINAQPAAVTVANHLVPNSPNVTFLRAGDFYWQVVYGGDANNNAATSPCTANDNEHLAIGKNSPSIATTLSATSAAIGDTVHDSSALTGATSGAGGSVTYTVYTNDTCTLGAQSAGTKTVANHLVPDSNGIQFNSAGDFYWQAVYSGDDNNNGATSACLEEHLVVAKNSPTIATLLSSDEVLVGASVHDSATLSGATSDAGGKVTYSYYTNNTCTLNAVEVSTADVSDGDVGDSSAVQFNTAGNFYWQAVYSGDANNNGATSPCNSENSEHLVVDQPSISITKNPKSQAIDSGATATFTITVTNTGTTTLTNVAVTDAQAPGCAKAIGTLTSGQSTSYTCSLANVTSSFTNSATATGHPPVGPDVTATDTAPVTVNAVPPPPPPPPAPPAPTIDLSITKTGSPNPAVLGNQITWTMTVKNAGPSAATGVTVADPVPAGTTFVSATSSQGTCTGGAVVNCTIGNMAVGATVTVTLVTTSTATGTIPNTATVVGNEAETNTANNSATASVVVNGPFVPPVKYCTAVGVAPKKTMFVGRKTTLTIKVTQNGKAVKGVRVKVKGAKLAITTKPSNAKGIVKVTVKPTKAGIVSFAPVAGTACSNPRIGVTGVFTPPVTG